ncbi:MAG: heavy metal translocating P-type ATPase, partial [Phycisphaerales bacterium]|nr:heavy metal translocating P-type ATPase [Phycisphaerales bacterium]
MTTDPSCAHCGLPVPAALRAANDGDPSFCCRACETVFDAIHANGLGRFYAMRDDARPESPPDVGRDYDVFDDDAFIPAHTRDAGSGRRVVEFHLQGVHCAACVWLVERLPHLVDGVIEARLDIGRHLATITWDPDRVALSTIARGLDSLGYVPHPRRAATLRDARRREDRRHLIRIGIAGACAANTMVIAFALYGARISGMDPTLALVFRVASLGLTLIAMLGPGRVFLTGARSSLRTGRLHMDVPVTIALLAGIAWGATNTIRGAGEVYFESLTTVIFLLLVGRWIQHRQQRRAADALELLFTLTPSTARRVQPDGSIREVPSASLRPGDHVEIRAGDTIPADGVVFDGRSTVDLSLLTGEARPIEVEVGALLHASTVNLGAPLVMDVTVTGDDTRVGRLMALVQSFSSTRPPIVRLADRVAHW